MRVTLKISDLRCPLCQAGAVAATGLEVYPHRPDLAEKRFYRCANGCACWAGVHGDGAPMAQLADKDTRAARMRAHRSFDALWKQGRWSRKDAYAALARHFDQGPEVHIGWMSAAECKIVEAWAEGKRRGAEAQATTPPTTKKED